MQLALSAVGAVIGGLIGTFVFPGVGTATGAEIGFAIGGMAGALLVHPKGPQPGDLRVQDSAYGRAIPVVYGMYRVAGNVIWAGQPINESGGGKGSAPSQAKVSMSFAVGLCEGPISGIRRIWANGKLIYDVSNPSNFQALSGSAQMTTNFALYLGDETQMPDPTMEAALGRGNVPAHRGLAYVVFNALDLSPWGNYMPSLSFEVLAGQSGTTYHSQIEQTYAPYSQTWLMSMNNLSENGGQVLMWVWYFGYDGLWVGNVTPYGSNTVFHWHPSRPPSISGIGRGYSTDEATLVDPNGWYDSDGFLHTGPYFVNHDYQIWGNEDMFSYVMQNGKLFTASDYPLGTPWITMCDTLTCTTQASTRHTLTGQMCIIGATDSYLYVMCGGYTDTGSTATHNTIYQLDANTLAIVNQWTKPAFSGAQTGYVLNDDFIYWVGINDVHLFRPSQGTDTIIGYTAAIPISFRAINENLFVFSSGTYGASVSFGYMATGVNPNPGVPLSTIVADICARAGMSPSQYDVSQLTDTVQGYAITNHSNTRANLAPLMATYFFDACDTDNQIKFVRRGSNPAGTFAYADLGASTAIGDQANENPIQEVIAQEVDLPRTLTLTYSGVNSDYLVNTQRAFRANTRSNKDVAMSAPIVLSDDEGLMRAQAMLWAAWVGRKTFTISTRLGYLPYEPGDVMTLYGESGQTYTVRVVRCQYDGQGSLIWDLQLEEPDIYPNPSYSTQGGAPAGFNAQSIDYSGPTALAVLDVPPLRDGDTSQGLYLAACGYALNWPGCMVDISRDGTSYTDLMRILAASPIGTASSALPDFHGGNQPDELSTVTVVLDSGTLASVSYANFLAGVNAAYLGGELLYFRNAAQTAANTYVLSGLLRGRVGTEWAMSTHAAGDLFVFLDATRIISLPLNLSDIGATLFFEAHLMNLFASQPVTPQKLVPAVARVKPLSPALFVAGHGSAASTTDISLSWIRRARVNAQWNDGADVPLDESAETYTLKIFNGSTLVRTVTVSAATAYTYTAANITADGFSAGNTISFTVAQNSDQGVLGYAAAASITR